MPKAPKVTVQSNVPKAIKTDSVTQRLANAWSFSDRITMNIYRKSGSGKTTFWATHPKLLYCRRVPSKLTRSWDRLE